ncbi:MAG: hypothetical protein GY810_08195 [Aureispira sp.]|nr:hypothetical protein [Aureispira sp.]
MKRFIIQTAGFVGVFFVLALSLFFMTNNVIQNKATFKIKEDTQYVVFGHSHPECAYNDSLIQDFQNFGNSGESYFYTQTKLQQVLRQNPKIETVFIEFTNNQIAEGRNEWIWSDKHITNRYPTFEAFMEKGDHFLLLKNNFSGFVNSFSLSIKNNIGRIISGDYNFTPKLGGYLYLEKNKVDSFLMAQEKSPATISTQNISTLSIKYLEKMVAYCQSQNKKVVLLRSPQHSKCLALKNEAKFREILETKFSDIPFLDFNEFPTTNAEFADLEHLNHKGAKRFSIWFNSLMQQGVMDAEDKQAFINTRMTAIN